MTISRKPDIGRIRARYNLAIMEYLTYFEKKQGIVFYEWVGDVIGGHAVLESSVFSFEDICYDVDTDQPKGRIFTWYELFLDLACVGVVINYNEYCESLNS